MNEELRIRVDIAGRVYPLSVTSEFEEEMVRKSAKKINNLIADYQKSYEVQDKQDMLAMCALQLASQSETENQKANQLHIQTAQKLKRLNSILSDSLS